MFTIDRRKTKTVKPLPRTLVSSYSMLHRMALVSGKAVPSNLGDFPVN